MDTQKIATFRIARALIPYGNDFYIEGERKEQNFKTYRKLSVSTPLLRVKFWLKLK